MKIEINESPDGLRRVTLAGRLDTPAVLDIEPRFVTGLVPGGKSAIVDLSQVEFISSMGIRMFLSVARTLQDKQARLVFYAPQQRVNEVLESTSFRKLVPVCANDAEAAARAQS